jgi:hypothetical protein
VELRKKAEKLLYRYSWKNKKYLDYEFFSILMLDIIIISFL